MPRKKALPENVVSLTAHKRKLRRQEVTRQKSFYELYPVPFFDAKARNTWNVEPTGNYVSDLELGKQCAEQFLATCDLTFGWSTLLGSIVSDMVTAGNVSGNRPNGEPKSNGLVIGFMGVITNYVMWTIRQSSAAPGGVA